MKDEEVFEAALVEVCYFLNQGHRSEVNKVDISARFLSCCYDRLAIFTVEGFDMTDGRVQCYTVILATAIDSSTTCCTIIGWCRSTVYYLIYFLATVLLGGEIFNCEILSGSGG